MNLEHIIGEANMKLIQRESIKNKVFIAIFLLSIEEYEILQTTIDDIENILSKSNINNSLLQILGHQNYIDSIRNANSLQKIFIHFVVPFSMVSQLRNQFLEIENFLSNNH